MPQYVRTVEVRWTGLGRLRAMLDPKGNERALQEGLNDVAIDVTFRAKRNAPVKTGRLSRSIRVFGRQSGPTRYIVAGTADVKYAAAHEAGSGIHGPSQSKYRIPRLGSRKMLFFPSQMALTDRFGKKAKLRKTLAGSPTHRTMRRYGNAAYVLTRFVMHPGVPATHYMKRAVEDSPMADLIAKAMVRYWRSR